MLGYLLKIRLWLVEKTSSEGKMETHKSLNSCWIDLNWKSLSKYVTELGSVSLAAAESPAGAAPRAATAHRSRPEVGVTGPAAHSSPVGAASGSYIAG